MRAILREITLIGDLDVYSTGVRKKTQGWVAFRFCWTSYTVGCILASARRDAQARGIVTYGMASLTHSACAPRSFMGHVRCSSPTYRPLPMTDFFWRVMGTTLSVRPPSVRIAETRFGLGVVATRTLETGEVILQFEGQLVDAESVYNSGAEQAYLLQVAPRHYVWPDEPARFVNHSCDPNAGLKDDVYLMALRCIEEGEEIYFDYSTSMEGDPWTMECGCGLPCCRSQIGSFGTLPPNVRNDYLSRGVVQRFIANRYEHNPRLTARLTRAPRPQES